MLMKVAMQGRSVDSMKFYWLRKIKNNIVETTKKSYWHKNQMIYIFNTFVCRLQAVWANCRNDHLSPAVFSSTQSLIVIFYKFIWVLDHSNLKFFSRTSSWPFRNWFPFCSPSNWFHRSPHVSNPAQSFPSIFASPYGSWILIII